MRRVMTAVLGTAAGTAMLIVVKSHLLTGTPIVSSAASGPLAPEAPTSTAPHVDAAPLSATVPPTTASPHARRRTPAPVTVIDPDRMLDGSWLGSPIPIPYGAVQVRITVTGGRLTDVVPVRLPTAAARGIEIGMRATPILRAQALTQQNALLDTVSGATYTSDGYRHSLQSALDAAHSGRPARGADGATSP